MNILMLTSLYPSDDIKFLNNTSVCHYFAKEWVTLGHKVKVIYTYHVYPWYYYPIIRLFRKILANRSGIAVPDKRLRSVYKYEKDSVHITRIPIFKKCPGGLFTVKEIESITNVINEELDKENFKADLILGHFLHPAIEIISELKKKLKVKTAVSLHGKENVYSSNTHTLLKNIDYLGYRSIPIGRAFEKLYGERTHFYCPSGVPEKYIRSQSKVYCRPINNFIYVGSLIQRKYPTSLLVAINSVYQNNVFSITFVGDGRERSKIHKIASNLNLDEKVRLVGRLNREEVTHELDKADVFIMISKDETFGLVYLEAMARGLIVVASKDEGMEGIIVDGVNGFLCNAGDIENLTSIIGKIKSMSYDELNAISRNALTTAQKMTDSQVAIQYLQSLGC